jgi:hypothetical protein
VLSIDGPNPLGEDVDMFFAIFWTAFIPFGMVMLSLVADWLRRSFRQVRAHAFASSGQRPVRRGSETKSGL